MARASNRSQEQLKWDEEVEEVEESKQELEDGMY